MIHPARLQFALLRNSKPSGQRDRLDSRSPEPFTCSEASYILPCEGSLNSPIAARQHHFNTRPAACSLFDDSDSSIKTHSADTQQRFSPIHF